MSTCSKFDGLSCLLTRVGKLPEVYVDSAQDIEVRYADITSEILSKLQ